jgi:hypothetical protein
MLSGKLKLTVAIGMNIAMAVAGEELTKFTNISSRRSAMTSTPTPVATGAGKGPASTSAFQTSLNGKSAIRDAVWRGLLAPLCEPAMDRQRLGNYSPSNVRSCLWIAESSVPIPANIEASRRELEPTAIGGIHRPAELLFRRSGYRQLL